MRLVALLLVAIVFLPSSSGLDLASLQTRIGYWLSSTGFCDVLPHLRVLERTTAPTDYSDLATRAAAALQPFLQSVVGDLMELRQTALDLYSSIEHDQ
jgi:hypothetical protein